MTNLPAWLQESLRCPVTGAVLEEEQVDGRRMLVARPEGREPLHYEIDNGVPVVLPANEPEE